MNYVDANFAAALHFTIQGTNPIAEKFVRKNRLPFVFSELAELECRRAFTLIAGKPNSENWTRLQGLLTSGVWHRQALDWKPVAERCQNLLDRFGSKLRAGILDTLHVAQALQCGCTTFLSFDNDSNARVLAGSCRLKVYPDLTV